MTPKDILPREPLYYEVQITLVPHVDGEPSKEMTFYKTENVVVSYDRIHPQSKQVTIEFEAILDEGRNLIGLEKDLKIANRCHCYEDLMKEDTRMTPKEALEVLRGHALDSANGSWGTQATAIENEVDGAYSDLLHALKKADLL